MPRLKNLILTFLVFTSLVFLYAVPKISFSHFRFYDIDDTLIWSSNIKLTWNDFRGAPRNDIPYAALSNSGVKYQIAYFDNHARITLQAYFNRARSWVKSDSVDDELLQHEYYHFCVTELFTRKLRKEMLNYKGSLNEVSPFLKRKCMAIYIKFARYQAKYDRATDHSVKSIVQKKWESKIDTEMMKYLSFSNEWVDVYYRN